MKKTDVHIFLWRARHTMCTSVFSFIPQGNEKNQQSILNKNKAHLNWPNKDRISIYIERNVN